VSLKRYRYTGKERDEETGFGNHGVRYYAVWLGRWVSSDPHDLEGGINLYEYGSTNPVTFVDLSGTAPKRYEDQRGKDTAAKQKEMKTNLETAEAKGYKPDPMQHRADNLAKKRGKTPIEHHHHKGVKQAADVKLDPKKMGNPMSSLWSTKKGLTKKDRTVQAGIGDEPVWNPEFQGKTLTHHNVAKHLDFDEQKKGPKTATGLENAAARSKERLPATVDLTERAKEDWGKLVDPRAHEGIDAVKPYSPEPEPRRRSATLGLLLHVTNVYALVHSIWKEGLTPETVLQLTKGYLGDKALSAGLEAFGAGSIGVAASGMLTVVIGLCGDGVGACKEQEKREAQEKAEQEIRDMISNYWDTNPGMTRKEAQDHVIMGLVVDQQREQDFWNTVRNAGRKPDPWR
jgi:RHS repeat-associated protein